MAASHDGLWRMIGSETGMRLRLAKELRAQCALSTRLLCDVDYTVTQSTLLAGRFRATEALPIVSQDRFNRPPFHRTTTISAATVLRQDTALEGAA